MKILNYYNIIKSIHKVKQLGKTPKSITIGFTLYSELATTCIYNLGTKCSNTFYGIPITVDYNKDNFIQINYWGEYHDLQ